MNVLVLNAGSSSLKFQLIATDTDRIAQDGDERLSRGQIDRIGGEAIVTIQNRDGPRQKSTAQLHDIAAALRHVVACLMSEQPGMSVLQGVADVHAIGHRVVHGANSSRSRR
jgi:acetate kinase